MPRNFVQRAFKHWLAENRQAFYRRPTRIKYCEGGIFFGLSGVSPGIHIFINKQGAVVGDLGDSENFRLLAYFDMREQRLFDGRYRCGFGSLAMSYPSRVALWESEVFQPLLKWTNEKAARMS